MFRRATPSAAPHGSIRIVSSARKCNARWGERPIAWSVAGFSGPAGVAAEVNQALEETNEDQAAEIKALNEQSGLGLSIPALPSALETKGGP